MSNESGPKLPPFASSYGASGLLQHVTHDSSTNNLIRRYRKLKETL